MKSRGEIDVRKKLEAAALRQESAPVCLIIVYDLGRTAANYGQGAEQYSLIEVGHIVQSLLLTATLLDVAALTEVVVDRDDTAFSTPTKPVGS